MNRLNQQSVFIGVALALQFLISVLLLTLVVSINENLAGTKEARIAATEQRSETLCILKIHPEDRTPERMKFCE